MSSIYDEYPDLGVDRHTAELLRTMDKRFSSGPSPIAGDYSRVVPGQVTPLQGTLIGAGIVSQRAVVAFAMKETMMMPAKGITVVPQGPGRTQQEGIHYAYVGDDTVHYPGKTYVDFIVGIFS